MGRMIVDATTSLDGFWADARGRSVLPAEERGASGLPESFEQACGALVMSGACLDAGAHAGGIERAHDSRVPVFVVDERRPPRTRSEAAPAPVHFVESYPAAFRAARAAAGDKAVLVLGEARSLEAALGTGEADEILLRVVSRTVGAGAPLFTADIPVENYYVARMETTTVAVHMHLERRLDG
ncbi:riboflavin biosynthesis protein RibD [Novosphingobium soli]|uniref:Riboflavin biosynthesis protein RibD n=1 Tax=Novosphingobium soli TaxID=574956 RepID=A0ABV6CX42_9SPHN